MVSATYNLDMQRRIGFSTLALFMKTPAEWAEIIARDGFNAVEILCEGPNWPRLAPSDEIADNLRGRGLEIYMHSPTIDLNPASVNRGIREETERQLKESVDMAAAIGARFVTTHPGVVHKDKVRGFCTEYAQQVLGEVADYARACGVTLSIENMPYRQTFLCNAPDELRAFQRHCRCGVTIDVGHAILCPEPREFLNLDGISYLHVNDNHGKKDQHLCPGDGILDLSMLDGQERMIIELDDYRNVLRARRVILDATERR
jgi:sugar phosphate isomerase/epimerase